MWARARTAIVLSMVAGVASGARAEEANGARYALRAEAGLEVDTNAHRSEVIGGVADPPLVRSALERLVLSGTLFDAVAPGQSVALSATAAAKIFDAPAATGEDVAIAQSSGAWRLALGDSARFTASGAYYEAFQSASTIPAVDVQRRDFRSLFPTLQLGWLPTEAVDLTLSAGWRWLVFKSDRDFDFSGPTAAVDLRWARQQQSGPDWEAGAGAALEHRVFGGPALTLLCSPSGLPCPGPDGRRDDFVVGHVEVTRTARVLLGAGYALQYNRSNSFGETVTRHFATARFATPLPFELTIAARAELLLAFYRDQVNVSAGTGYISIDDENRSSARVNLSRPLGDQLRIFARYTLYLNELGNNAGSYTRQTILLSLAYTLEH